MDWLGKLLFPKQHQWKRRKQLRSLGLALFLATLVSFLLGVAIYWVNLHHGN